MSTVVVESFSGRREMIKVGLEKGKYSTLTFKVANKIGVISEVHRVNGHFEYIAKVLIHPQGDKRPPICILVHLVKSISDIDETLIYSAFVEIADPFSVPWKTYLDLPREEAERLKERAWEENSDWIREEIKSRDTAWILVCGREIIQESNNLEEYPSREELEKIAEKCNLFPFVFVRSPLIEETNWNEIKATKSKSDYYPTLKINICGNLELIGDLDTGNPITTLNKEQLKSSGNLEPSLITSSQKYTFLEKPYKFWREEVHIQITDDTGKKESKFITCDWVEDWAKSPFCIVNPNREALVGRDILLKFPLKVSLDGKEKKTYIYL